MSRYKGPSNKEISEHLGNLSIKDLVMEKVNIKEETRIPVKIMELFSRFNEADKIITLKKYTVMILNQIGETIIKNKMNY